MSSPSTIDAIEGDQKEEARTTMENWLGELVVLSFRENRRGGDPIAHTGDGRAVFPDKYQGGDEILPGEHWVCSVSQKGESTFFATPVARLDTEFFGRLSPEEQMRLARVAAEEYPDVLGEQIDEALEQMPFAGEKGPRSDPGLLEVVQERDELQAQLSELSEQYDEAVARLVETEHHLQSLEKQIHNERVDSATPPEEGAHDGAKRTEPIPKEARFPVTREGEDVLHCEVLGEGNYHGHVSPNRRTLFFKAYGRGPLSCEDGRIEVPGLGRILDDDVSRLEARFDSRHGGFFVEIPRR